MMSLLFCSSQGDLFDEVDDNSEYEVTTDDYLAQDVADIDLN
jgi:hypothetical protein